MPWCKVGVPCRLSAHELGHFRSSSIEQQYSRDYWMQDDLDLKAWPSASIAAAGTCETIEQKQYVCQKKAQQPVEAVLHP